MCAEFTIHPGYILNAFALGWWLDESVIQLNKKVHRCKFQKNTLQVLGITEKPNGTFASTTDVPSTLKLQVIKKILPSLKKHQRNCQGLLGWNSALKWLFILQGRLTRWCRTSAFFDSFDSIPFGVPLISFTGQFSLKHLRRVYAKYNSSTGQKRAASPSVAGFPCGDFSRPWLAKDSGSQLQESLSRSFRAASSSGSGTKEKWKCL